MTARAPAVNKYKATDAGLVPQDWDVQTIGDVASVSSGGTPRRDVQAYWGGSIPWITTSQIDFNLIQEADQFITEEGLRNSAAKLLPAGTLLLALYGQGKTRGKVAMLKFRAASNQACASINVRGPVSGEFLFHFLASRYDAIRNSSNSGGQENLSGLIVKGIPVVVPPRAEQTAIVNALADVGALLATLDALISKKRDLKRATMQQLLTGQTRLPGFNGEWKAKRLGEMGQFLKGRGVRKDEALTGDLACIRYGELYTRHNDCIRAFYSWISEDIARDAVRLRRGDILFAGSGETKEEIGKCAAFLDNVEAYAGGDIIIFRPHASEPVFMGYYLNTRAVNTQKASRGQGDAVVHITAGALSDVEVCIPGLTEQAAIAAVLSGMDQELSSLEARREKTRALKEGMMQELLTGRIRLTPEVS